MDNRKRFIDRYEEGNTPWVHTNPDFNLVDMVENWPINPCKALDMGCGTGVEAIWLAENNFSVTAIDGSPIAIDLAKNQIDNSEIDCSFKVCDFINDEIGDTNFDFVFDRGFFHTFDSDTERKIVSEKVSKLLKKRGLWLTLMGSADAPPRESGPPMRSASEIISAVEPYFKILTLTVSFFGNDEGDPAKIWVCLMRKR